MAWISPASVGLPASGRAFASFFSQAARSRAAAASSAVPWSRAASAATEAGLQPPQFAHLGQVPARRDGERQQREQRQPARRQAAQRVQAEARQSVGEQDVGRPEEDVGVDQAEGDEEEAAPVIGAPRHGQRRIALEALQRQQRAGAEQQRQQRALAALEQRMDHGPGLDRPAGTLRDGQRVVEEGLRPGEGPDVQDQDAEHGNATRHVERLDAFAAADRAQCGDGFRHPAMIAADAAHSRRMRCSSG
jgi:hypothetical protein